MLADSATATSDWSLWSTTARLVVTEPAVLDDARELVDAELAAIEHAASRFRSDSELSSLRRGRNQISPLLAELVAAALAAAQRTDGAVDPTVGSSMDALGYDRDIRDVELVQRDDGTRLAIIKPAPGWRRVQLSGRILTLAGGVRLDLGASAKAVAADRCARLVAASLDTGVLVSLGGDITTAGPGPAGDWQIEVCDGDGEPATQVGLPAGAAMATSSTLHRRWTRAGHPMHHLLDPRTGLPAQAWWRTVTVVAPTCLAANTLSTATVVRGQAGLGWLRGQRRPARLVDQQRRVVRLDSWPAEVAA